MKFSTQVYIKMICTLVPSADHWQKKCQIMESIRSKYKFSPISKLNFVTFALLYFNTWIYLINIGMEKVPEIFKYNSFEIYYSFPIFDRLVWNIHMNFKLLCEKVKTDFGAGRKLGVVFLVLTCEQPPGQPDARGRRPHRLPLAAPATFKN